MHKKLIYGMILGAILGIFCIVGASLRLPDHASFSYLLSFWYNRVILGALIGLLPSLKSLKLSLLRGLLVGALVSFAFYSATNFLDLMGFFAGFAYGVIIEFVLFKLNQSNKL
ncbi:MAG: hypothetical protein K8Q99_06095 [Acholeplasmataceae bacterium]|nr:hypothetical protein [Acholeplasmataceae bacterium]